eukprot:XP_011661522.1 PREDICTED: carbonic anhydrase-related protein 11 [Strongylocentrotus purpuratus]
MYPRVPHNHANAHTDVIRVVLAFYSITTDSSMSLQSYCEPARTWSEIWSYDGLKGPAFWGRMYSAWFLCSKGQRQSPIDLRAESLVYDPNLPQLEIDSPAETNGIVNNTGRGISFFPDPANVTYISRGPLSYRYRLVEIRLHFGGENTHGSEHTVGGRAFPGELQLIFFNDDLYDSYGQAEKSPNGLAIMGLFIKEGNMTGRELGKLSGIHVLRHLVYKGSQVNVSSLKYTPSSTRNQGIYDVCRLNNHAQMHRDCSLDHIQQTRILHKLSARHIKGTCEYKTWRGDGDDIT